MCRSGSGWVLELSVRWAQALGDSFLCQQPFGEVHTLLELAESALHVVERLREARDVGLGGILPGALVRASDEPSRHNVRGRDHNDDERGADGPVRNAPHAPPPARLLRRKEAPAWERLAGPESTPESR